MLLLLAPLATGFVAPPEEEPIPKLTDGEEVLLVLNDDVWTSSHWNTLVEDGIQPLRSVRSDALLVWTYGQDAGGIDAAIEPFDDAQYLNPLEDVDLPVPRVRLVMEPRLPEQAVHHLLSTVTQWGTEIIDQRAGFASIPSVATVVFPSSEMVQRALELPGILWIEPVLETRARNGLSSELLQSGEFNAHPFWNVGLNGTGVILGVADSGVDADHACFRNATTANDVHAESNATYPAVGQFGAEHRKILLLNTTVDGNDTPGHSDYRHGTHVIGSLACHTVDSYRSGLAPSNGTTLAHGSKLVIQDIVSEDGWAPPPVDELLWEASSMGAVIHSNSWGDDTTAYTERTGRFDAYARAMPWSVAFIAPGNGGEGVLEPANGRNVVAVGATTKSESPERWGSSAYGPTEADTNGIFLLATGANLQSASADGFWNTNNNNLRPSSGTSMSTPMAAGAAGLIQQLYQNGWLHGPNEPVSMVEDLHPSWAAEPASALLAEGFTPSGPMLRATLALATTSLDATVANGGQGGHALQNPYDGWGVLNLSALIDVSTLTGHSPAPDVWVHDSYRLDSNNVQGWFGERTGGSNGLEALSLHPWNGTGAAGPFLSTGDVVHHRFTPLPNETVRVRLAFPAQPSPSMVDDLQLRIVLENGDVLLPNRLQADGAPTRYYGNVADFNNTSVFPASNETVYGIDIPAAYLVNASMFDVEIVARYVQPGGQPGTIGLDGDSVGYSLIVQGVDRDSTDHIDGDGDGIPNIDDACPFVDASPADANRDGCLDDDDEDTVPNHLDLCPLVSALGFDLDQDGCIDDTDGDGVGDDVDACLTQNLAWPVTESGCYPIDQPPVFTFISGPNNNTTLGPTLEVQWSVLDGDADLTRTEIELVFEQQPNITVLACLVETAEAISQRCQWNLPDDLAPFFVADERYTLRATVTTNNASPAAISAPTVLTLAEGLTMEINDGEVVDATTPNRSALGIWLGLFGLIGGALVAKKRFASKQERHLQQHPPPFASFGDDED